jgi:hypothetical protein
MPVFPKTSKQWKPNFSITDFWASVRRRNTSKKYLVE